MRLADRWRIDCPIAAASRNGAVLEPLGAVAYSIVRQRLHEITPFAGCAEEGHLLAVCRLQPYVFRDDKTIHSGTCDQKQARAALLAIAAFRTRRGGLRMAVRGCEAGSTVPLRRTRKQSTSHVD
jgi:hypothetical protein